MNPLLFSVVIPVRDGGPTFAACLRALRQSRFRRFELIVVDDGSSDDSGNVEDATVITLDGKGPAAARNRGVQEAHAPYLFFLDADCEVDPSTLERAAQILETEPGLDALFGSYDDEPASDRFVAVWKNLQHHFVHQHGNADAGTFWAGCGVVRRSAFLAVGGFDAQRYRRPSIEDIELGGRLRDAGYRIRLAPEVQVKHHKVWTLSGLIRTDVFARGVPWTELMLERRQFATDLNVDRGGRLSAAAALVVVGCAVLAPFAPWLLAFAAGSAAALVFLNRGFYRFLAGRRGIGFVVPAVALHGLYHLYCAFAFGLGGLRFSLRRAVGRSARRVIP